MGMTKPGKNSTSKRENGQIILALAIHLDQSAAWLNITTTLICQVYYKLPATTTLSQHQCETITMPCLLWNGMAAARYAFWVGANGHVY